MQFCANFRKYKSSDRPHLGNRLIAKADLAAVQFHNSFIVAKEKTTFNVSSNEKKLELSLVHRELLCRRSELPRSRLTQTQRDASAANSTSEASVGVTSSPRSMFLVEYLNTAHMLVAASKLAMLKESVTRALWRQITIKPTLSFEVNAN